MINFKLDFRTKLLIVVVMSFVLNIGNFQHNHLYLVVAISLFPYLLIINEGRVKSGVRGILIIILAFIVQKYLLFNIKGVLTPIFQFITMVFLRLTPPLMMGKYILLTTSMSELVLAMKKMRFPDTIIIPISVMAKFFFSVGEDYQQIKNAMYLHGLTTTRLITKPLLLFEYKLIPLLMCVSASSDDVAISALTRGMKVGSKRSSVAKISFKTLDIIMIIIVLIVIWIYVGDSYA